MTDPQLQSLAQSHLQKFVQKISDLIHRQSIQFDLIVGSGNTGILAAKITELIYESLNIPTPPVIQIPVLRYKGPDKPENLFDNSVLYPEVTRLLTESNVQKLENVLFVDDEIYAGHAVKAVMKLLVEYKKQNQLPGPTNCFIVAEDQGVDPNFSIPEVAVKLELFAEGTDDYGNVLAYFMPDELVSPIAGVVGEQLPNHTYINILLGLPIRGKGENVVIPKFTDKYTRLAESQVENYHDLKDRGYIFINEEIEKSLVKHLKS